MLAGGSVVAGVDLTNVHMENKLAGTGLPSILHRITTSAEPGSSAPSTHATPSRRVEGGAGLAASRFSEYSASPILGAGAGTGAGVAASVPGDWVGALNRVVSEAPLLSARVTLRPVEASGELMVLGAFPRRVFHSPLCRLSRSSHWVRGSVELCIDSQVIHLSPME